MIINIHIRSPVPGPELKVPALKPEYYPKVLILL